MELFSLRGVELGGSGSERAGNVVFGDTGITKEYKNAQD
jgi:hypothetical protein